MVGLAVVGTVLLLVASGERASEVGGPADWVSVVKIGLGIALLVLAVTQWRGRPRGDARPELPGWMTTVDTLSAVKSAGTAVLSAAVKPKNLILILGACAAISQTGASTASQGVALAVFVLVASVGIALPLAIDLFMGDRATTILSALRDWMARENATIIAVICLVIGVTLIGDAISALTA
jgi:Sap, sulfolipid-1-addressing protein